MKLLRLSPLLIVIGMVLALTAAPRWPLAHQNRALAAGTATATASATATTTSTPSAGPTPYSECPGWALEPAFCEPAPDASPTAGQTYYVEKTYTDPNGKVYVTQVGLESMAAQPAANPTAGQILQATNNANPPTLGYTGQPFSMCWDAPFGALASTGSYEHAPCSGHFLSLTVTLESLNGGSCGGLPSIAVADATTSFLGNAVVAPTSVGTPAATAQPTPSFNAGDLIGIVAPTGGPTPSACPSPVWAACATMQCP
jgi:hypothetical protein